MKKKELLNIILDLPVSQRAELADALLESLHPIDPEIQDAWVEEVHRRMKSVEDGTSTLIPGEEVMKEIDDIINRQE